MALPVRDQVKYWGIAAAVFVLVLWFLGDVILPFVLGGAVAYFLDPVADRLERMGASRAVATATITLVAILVFILLALLVIPTLVNQTVNLFDTAPQLFRDLLEFINTRFPGMLDDGSVLRQSLASLGETIRDRGGQLLESLLNSAASVINVTSPSRM